MDDLIFYSMIICHIIADYNLQGWLASAKCKDWWQQNAPDKLYRNDYWVALFMHSLFWSFMIILPLIIYRFTSIDSWFVLTLGINTAIHAAVDNLKANEKKINLITDQIIHMFQIMITFAVITVSF